MKCNLPRKMRHKNQAECPSAVLKSVLVVCVALCLLPINHLFARDDSTVKLRDKNLINPYLTPKQTQDTDATLLATSRLEKSVCAFSEEFDKYDATCGTLFVRENSFVNSSHIEGIQQQKVTPENAARMVSIPIIIFQPEGEITGEPLIITGGGGPGSAIYIMKDFDGDPSLFYSGVEASTLKNGRQLILMEMRGSGESKANLDCPAITDLEIEFLGTYPYKWDNKKVTQVQTACAKAKKAQEIDGNFYNTDYAVQDIEALRSLLNIDKWHLLGISHGSRISMRYAQKFPHRASSLVLDSIYPFDVDAYAEVAQFSQQTYKQPFTLCDANPKCRLEDGVPSIYAFEALLRQVKEKPLVIDVEYFDEDWDALTKKLKVSPELLVYTLFNISYDSEAILDFPFVVKDALKKDYKKLSKLISETIDLQNYTWFSEGAYASYACYEEIPFSNFPLALKNAQDNKIPHWNDEELIIFDQQLCKIWNIRPATNDIKTYDYSQLTLPILILAGELDSFTPLKWAVDFHNKLPMKNKTQHLRVWPLKAHNLVYDDACVESVMTSFLNSPEQTIDNECAVTDASLMRQRQSEQTESQATEKRL